MKDYNDFENHILKIIQKEDYFIYKGKKYKILFCGKPKKRRGGGEPKTDIFIRTKFSDKNVDFKISAKMNTKSYFLENKITKERLHEIFKNKRINFLKEKFGELVFNLKCGRFEKNLDEKKFLLGMKCEILKNDNRKRRISIKGTKQETYEIYSGSKRPNKYKNAVVNDFEIKNSGVADYLLISNEDKIRSIEDISEKMISIEDYIKKDENRSLDICFTGLNIFPIKSYKFDGNRPLFAFFEWGYKDGKIIGNINYKNPLSKKANEVAASFKSCHIQAVSKH